jgi:Fe-S cluster biogenesis protein NfuA
MFIQTQDTPNPDTLKFIPGVLVSENRAIAFATTVEANSCPLAQQLLEKEDVREVFMGYDFISITKRREANWDVLRPIALTIMTNFFLSTQPLFSEARTSLNEQKNNNTTTQEDDGDVVTEIKALLAERVRPFVATHGGDITFQSFRDGTVYLQLFGACSGCPSSTMTLKAGIENMLRHYIPEVQSVEAVNL